MYKFDRHPIMTGALIGMWCTPTMRVDHLLFATVMTIYITVGVYFEERSLARQWGDVYVDYSHRVRTVVPGLPIVGRGINAGMKSRDDDRMAKAAGGG